MDGHQVQNLTTSFESLWKVLIVWESSQKAQISSLNKLCNQFNTNILAGCKTQADWHQASKEQQFRNVIGVGMKTRSIVAHNINEQMQQNQFGRCTMMAIGHFSAEVIETGVDPYRLGRWCWLRVGSGDKNRIVMAYQPSGSKLTIPPGQL
jgi:hypothetical protein